MLHRSGFREYHLSDGSDLSLVTPEDEALTTHLHILGGTGLTAYGGLLVTGELKEGENVFVSAAAGAVGSVVCQIAKIRDCRVAGSCGSDEKVDYLKNQLGIDHAFNYKTGSISRELHIGLPDGIDVYFENVGGAHLNARGPDDLSGNDHGQHRQRTGRTDRTAAGTEHGKDAGPTCRGLTFRSPSDF